MRQRTCDGRARARGTRRAEPRGTRIASTDWVDPSEARDVPNHVSENIERVARLHHVEGARVSRHQRAVEATAQWLGRPQTLYFFIPIVAAWVVYNAGAAARGWRAPDPPPFFWLQGTLTLYASLVATAVLTAQNQQTRENVRRAHLELQVSLLAEQKATKVIALLEELRRDLPNVANRRDSEAEAMQTRPDPKSVLAALENTMEMPSSEPGEPEGKGHPR